LRFLWGANWIYMCYVEESRPPLKSSGQSSWLQNGDVLCFLWGTNWIYICYVEESRPLLWSCDQSSWLQVLRSGFYSRRYQIFWEVVGLSGVHWATWVQLGSYLEENVAALVYKAENTVVGSRHVDYVIPLYPPKLALTSPLSSDRSVLSRTQATEIFMCMVELSFLWFKFNYCSWYSATSSRTFTQLLPLSSAVGTILTTLFSKYISRFCPKCMLMCFLCVPY
jgi:hypothetical protein